MRLGVYGGSFDPPHVAHVLAAAYALATGGLDQVLVVPVFAHAFHKALTPFEHRLKLCELAFDGLARVQISAIEARLPTPSRTLTTLEALRAEQPDAELRLVIGTDLLGEVSKWHAFDEVCALAPPLVIGRRRTGNEATHFALPDVSSTRVRELLAERTHPEARAELAEVVPARVLAYIEQHGLYRG